MSRNKAIIIVVAIAIMGNLLLFVGGGIGFFYWFNDLMRFNQITERSGPPELRKPGVSIGAELLSKDRLFTDARLGVISDIRINPYINSDWQVACAGHSGAAFYNLNKNSLISFIPFPEHASNVRFLDRPDSKDIWYINRGGKGWTDAALLTPQGEKHWSCGMNTIPQSPGVNSMCAGDIDNNVNLRCVVGFNGDGGISMLDQDGKELWHQDDHNVWQVEMIDVEKDAFKEIVHTNASGSFTVRDHQGNVLRKFGVGDPKSYITQFALCSWPTKKDAQHIITIADDRLYLIDAFGKIKAEFKTPFVTDSAEIKATTVKLKANEPEYLAVAINYDYWDKTVLYLFDQNGKIVYMETLSGKCGAITAAPINDPSNNPINNKETEDLWLNTKDSVWHYQIAK